MARSPFGPTAPRLQPQVTGSAQPVTPAPQLSPTRSLPTPAAPGARSPFPQLYPAQPQPGVTKDFVDTATKTMIFGSPDDKFNLLAGGGLTSAQHEVALQIASRYNRPSTTLGAIARILNVGVNLSVGTAQAWDKAAHEWSDGNLGFKDIWRYNPAWVALAAASHPQDTFSEIPKAVWENKTYSEFLQENADPNSFLYRHAMPVGLSMDIALDPTTYLTFGATAASKSAARGILVGAYEQSYESARAAMAAGHYTHPDGFEEALKGSENIHDLAGKIHFLEGKPQTFGDAMARLGKNDQALRDEVRATQIQRKAAKELGIDAPKLSARTYQKALFRSAAPRGGFGIRFAGEQLVPTKVTEGAGRAVRQLVGAKPATFTAERSIRPEGEFTRLADLTRLPDETFTRMNEDVLRAMITDQVRQAPRDAAFLTHQQAQEARDLFKLPEKTTAGTTTDVAVLARAKQVAHIIFGRDLSYVPYDVRKGLFREGFKSEGKFGGPYAKQLKDIRETTLANKARYISDAINAGWPESEVNKLNDLWDNLVTKYEDPLDVATIFPIHVGARIFNQKTIDGIFANPMFAAPISEHTADLEKAATHLDRVTEHYQNTFEKLKAARKAKKPKSTITRFHNQVEELRAQVQEAKVEHGRLSELQKSELEGSKRVVADLGEFRARIGQDTVVETWRGKKYAVPQMVSDAVREMRNPKAVDKRLEKSLHIMNWTQNKWKILATLVNSSFHVMNLVGGMWNNMLGGTNNFFDHMEAYANTVRARSEASDKLTFANKVRGRFSPLDEDAQLKLQEARRQKAIFLHQFMQRSGAGGGQVHVDITGEGSPHGQLLKSGPDRGINVGGRKLRASGKVRQALTGTRRIYGGTAVTAAVLPDEWVPDDVQDALNPVVGGALLLPEFIKVGRHVSSDVEDTLRTAPLIAAEKDQSLRQLTDAYSINPPTHWGKYMGEEVLDLNRVQLEAVYAIGARNALHYQFDYSDLSNFERNWAKTVFPFYVFYKNNFILQAREVVNKPRFVNTFFDVQNYMDSLSQNEDNPYFKSMLPEYFDKLDMFRVPVPNFMRDQLGIPHGQDVYLNPKLPFASLNLFPPLWELTNDGAVTPTPQRWAQVLAPAFGAVGPFAGGLPFKPMLEYSVGYNLGLARPIDFQRASSNDYRQSFTPAPGYLSLLPGPIRDRFGVFKDPQTGQLMMHSSVKYITDQLASPFLGSFGDAATTLGGDSPATAQQKANTFAWMTGIRLTPVDPIKLQRGWLYRMENYLQGQKGDAKSRGVPFPEEDARLLAQIRAQLKGVERAYDQEQQDLFGGNNGTTTH